MSHEDQLFAVLEKLGQPTERHVTDSPGESSVLDSVTFDYAQTEETSGPSDDPNVGPPRKEVGIPEGLARISRKNLFVHHDTHPVVFDVSLLSKYQADWFTWEPETLWKEIKEDFRVPSISDHAKAKIQAIKTLHINEWFWTKWEVFCWVSQALNNNIPDFQVIQKPSAAQLMNAVEIATMVRSGEDFTPEVQMFAAAAMVDDGVFYAPKPIRFCQDEIVRLLEEKKIENASDLISQVQARYQEVNLLPSEAWSGSGEPILGENVVDIQVAKLKVACDYVFLRQRQLKAQLRLLT